MTTLADFERAFAAATIFGDRDALASLGIVAHGATAERGLAIYRNTILGNYRRALGAAFPVTKALVGIAFFDAAIEHYVRRCPSTEGDVDRYGAGFPDFISGYAPASHLLYLGDVARLEWALAEAHGAPDAAALDLAALAAVPAARVGELRFTLDPAARLVTSRYPVLRIWQVNQRGHEGDDTVDLDAAADTLLVLRRGGAVGIERLSAGEHAFLSALASASTLSDAAAHAGGIDHGFDAAVSLPRFAACAVLVGFSLGATSTTPASAR